MLLAGRDRNTRDLDVVTCLGPDDLERLKQALRKAGFAHHDRADRHALEGLVLYRFWLPIGDTDMSMPLDLQDGRTEFHLSVLDRAREVDLGDVRLRVAATEDLILLKVLAWRPIDRADAVELIRLWSGEMDRAYLEAWSHKLDVARVPSPPAMTARGTRLR